MHIIIILTIHYDSDCSYVESQSVLAFHHTGDEFVDIHGKAVSGMTVAQVVEVIKAAPEVVIATVRPITVLKKFQLTDTSRSHYSTILPQTTPNEEPNGAKAVVTHDPVRSTSHDADLDDVGNYDDEDDGDAPPPLPPRTEDAFILVDPPPLGGKLLACMKAL